MSNPQDRYKTTLETKQLPNGRVVYRSVIPKKIEINPFIDPVETGTDFDRMDVISYNVYRTPLDWWKLASANGRVDGSLYFRPGETFYIPKK